MSLNLEYFLTLRNYMKKKVQITIKFTTFSTKKKKNTIKFYAKKINKIIKLVYQQYNNLNNNKKYLFIFLMFKTLLVILKD